MWTHVVNDLMLSKRGSKLHFLGFKFDEAEAGRMGGRRDRQKDSRMNGAINVSGASLTQLRVKVEIHESTIQGTGQFQSLRLSLHNHQHMNRYKLCPRQ